MLDTETQTRIDGVVIGVVTGISPTGDVLVAFGNNPEELPIPAKAATAVCAEDVGRQAAILFENGNTRKPVVMGLIQSLQHEQERFLVAPEIVQTEDFEDTPEAIVDGKKLVLQAEESIELKCGKASITLTRAGKIIVRGAYLSSKSSGVNRIHGGSVQIN